MKAITLYKSKYGACEEIANIIEKELAVPCISISELKKELKQFDTIIIGSGVYAGMFNKEVKAFLKEHEKELLSKKLYFYLTGLVQEGDTLKKQWEDNIPEALLQHSFYKEVLGARLNFPKMNFAEKGIIKMLNKKELWVSKEQMNQNIDLLDYEKIQQFITILKNG